MNDAIKPGRYRHFKGGEYEVIELALHSETEEPLVVYRPLYGERRLWVRPLPMFIDLKELDGRMVPRFVRIDEGSSVRSSMQHEVAGFCNRHGLESGAPARLLDLVSELGELAKVWLKASDYGRNPLAAPEPGDWQAEYGDTLFALLCLANESGIDVDIALARTLARYRQRIENAGHPGSDAEKR